MTHHVRLPSVQKLLDHCSYPFCELGVKVHQWGKVHMGQEYLSAFERDESFASFRTKAAFGG